MKSQWQYEVDQWARILDSSSERWKDGLLFADIANDDAMTDRLAAEHGWLTEAQVWKFERASLRDFLRAYMQMMVEREQGILLWLLHGLAAEGYVQEGHVHVIAKRLAELRNGMPMRRIRSDALVA